MYDFHKTKEDALEFSHPLFQKNNENLLKDIRRKIAESPIFKETTLELGDRLKKFQTQQNTMEEMLDELEKQYDKIVEQNQILIGELMQSKQREKRIEMYILKIEEKMKEEKKKESQTSSADAEEFLKLSPLSSDE
jgi:chromosome segregation ATPase